MTIDERLEELKGKHEILSERHNALVLSIELMVLENRDETRKRDGLWKAHMETWKVQNEAWAQRFGQIASSLDQLVHVAELHQHRMDSHDDRIDRLEGAA